MIPTSTNLVNMDTDVAITEFWARARQTLPGLPEKQTVAWSFGATPKHADELLDLVLEGTKTGTASSLWDHHATDEPIPYVGEHSIILDGLGRPRSIIETYDVQIVPFNEVTEEHAHAEGEGDRTLQAWQEIHREFWKKYSESPTGFRDDMPVVCERFRVIYREDPGN